jgi:cytochrome P450
LTGNDIVVLIVAGLLAAAILLRGALIRLVLHPKVPAALLDAPTGDRAELASIE